MAAALLPVNGYDYDVEHLIPANDGGLIARVFPSSLAPRYKRWHLFPHHGDHSHEHSVEYENQVQAGSVALGKDG